MLPKTLALCMWLSALALYPLSCNVLLAAALSPDKDSLAAERLKENLRAEGVLGQLVYATHYHAVQQDQAVSTSSQAVADDRYMQ